MIASYFPFYLEQTGSCLLHSNSLSHDQHQLKVISLQNKITFCVRNETNNF